MQEDTNLAARLGSFKKTLQEAKKEGRRRVRIAPLAGLLPNGTGSKMKEGYHRTREGKS